MRAPVLSIVIPMHNEADNIDALLRRLGGVLDRLGLPSEILCVDDGSRDGTPARLAAAREGEPRLKYLALSRNFGKEIAIAAGLRYAAGEAVVLMDADLQHPPELIEDFVVKWREGYLMVYGQRRSRVTDGLAYRWLASSFYRAFALLSETPLPPSVGDFRLMDRKVVDALNAISERTRFTKGLYAWVGFRQIGVPFEVAERHSGRSAWRPMKLWHLAVDGITAFSTLPLRFWSYLGVMISLAAMFSALYFTVRTLLFGADVPGYPSLIVAIMFFAGVQLIGLGIIGEYVGRIFTEVKQRPLFIVAEEHGFEPSRLQGQRTAWLAAADGKAVPPRPAAARRLER